jgi:predicted dehydrogenase
MSDGSGFTAMAGARATGEAPEIGFGMLGYAFMGKAHSNAMLKIPHMMYPPPAIPVLEAICGRDQEATAEAARRFGYRNTYSSWEEMLGNDNVQVLDNGGPNNVHAAPSIAAAEAGKHIICEKPLARTAAEAKPMLEAVQKAGVKHACAFNYRFVPALRLAREMIERGELGQIFHFRAVYLQEWIMDPQFPMVWRLKKDLAGSGALGDLGAHIIDLARFLVGEPTAVSGLTQTFIKERPTDDGGRDTVDVDDAFVSLVQFANGAIGTLEASRYANGRKNHQRIEINGSKGSIVFDLERLNELEVHLSDSEPGAHTQGFRRVLVTEADHPFWKYWWPHGHIIGWEHTFVHELTHLLDAIVNDTAVAPYAADFEDGYRAAVICDAVLESDANGGALVPIQY